MSTEDYIINMSTEDYIINMSTEDFMNYIDSPGPMWYDITMYCKRIQAQYRGI